MKEALKLSDYEYYLAVIMWVIGYFSAAAPSKSVNHLYTEQNEAD